NISGLTQQKVLESLDQADRIDDLVKNVLSERIFLEDELDKLHFVLHVFPSHANFLLVKMDQARKIYEYLIHDMIIVRDRSKVVLCEDCLRISVGTREENIQLIEALNRYEPIIQNL
ncbi:MAG: aminotransferase class I/II-fold pyridoxal phosphate-dependent enzyme, partial [Cyclobacteriaceae bacterium]|nr:aminotransferase class I/II-fold pyridoxal phosphate-dependent enzyme [Cyclobacteriaceae bacterium]